MKWLKAEGDGVLKDDLLFEMETDKAIMEVPAPEEGTLLRILVTEGPVRVEQVVGWVGHTGERVEGLEPPTVQNFESPHAPGPPLETRHKPAIAATPAARRRAKELGVDIARLSGAGPGGRITQEDVELAAEPDPLRERAPLIRRITSTWQTVPHIHVGRHMDAAGVVGARSQLLFNASITDLLLFLLARILPEFPKLTRVWNGERLENPGAIDIAVAVDTDKGVVSAVIHNAASLRLEELSKRRRELTEAARAHRLKVADVEGGIFTLTNLGMKGVDFFAPVINAPQTAILAVGRASQEPVVTNGALGAGWRMWANLAVDHRAADGMEAARFLTRLQNAIDQLPGLLSEVP